MYLHIFTIYTRHIQAHIDIYIYTYKETQASNTKHMFYYIPHANIQIHVYIQIGIRKSLSSSC